MGAKTKDYLFNQRKTILAMLYAGMAPRMIQKKIPLSQTSYYKNLDTFKKQYEVFPDDGCEVSLTCDTLYRSAVAHKIHLLTILGYGPQQIADILQYSRSNINVIRNKVRKMRIGFVNTFLEATLDVSTTGTFFGKDKYTRIAPGRFYITLGTDIEEDDTIIEGVDLSSVEDYYKDKDTNYTVLARNLINKITITDPYPLRPYEHFEYQTHEEYEEGRRKFAEYKKKNP